MARPKIGLSTGKKVKRHITQGQGGSFKKARRPDAVNLSNTYGIKGSSGSVGKGAVTQGKPANKTYKRAKRVVLGKGDI
jgi:hypothetical protein